MGIVIKKLETDEEIKGKAYVHWKSWHEAYKDIVKSDYLEKLTLEKCEEMAFKWPENTFIAVECDDDSDAFNGKVVGFSSYGDHGYEAPQEAEVTAIYVFSEYYGTGVGKELMEAALEAIKDYPCQEIRLFKDNGRAISFYKKFGFTLEEGEEYLEGLGASVIRMSRKHK